MTDYYEVRPVKVAIEFDPQEVWAQIFGASPESYSWWYSIKHITGDWDSPGEVEIRAEDPQGDDNPSVGGIYVPMDVIEAAEKTAAQYALDFEDLDASAADIVLQIMVYGEVVFG